MRESFFQYSIDYKKQGIMYLEPMTAKEVTDENAQAEILGSSDYTVEEKFDGVRQTLHFYAPNHREYDGSLFSQAEKSILIPFLRGLPSYVLYEFYDIFQKGNCSLSSSDIFLIFKENEEIISTSLIGVLLNRGNKSSLYIGSSKDKMTQFKVDRVAKVMSILIESFCIYPYEGCTRAFSRRVSTKTKWLSENTDSLPQLRNINVPELAGTILDGELKLDNADFGETSGIMNCLWDEAVRRQEDKGFLTYHVFDLTHYKGIDVRKFPLKSRRKLLKKVLKILHRNNADEYIVPIPYYRCDSFVRTFVSKEDRDYILNHTKLYPLLSARLLKENNFMREMLLTPGEYYEYIVATGGEGVMVKPISGKYYSKRGREYQKIKKFISRDMIILGFESPTKEYTGEFPNDSWDYWESPYDNSLGTCSPVVFCELGNKSAKQLLKEGYTPLTRFYAKGLVGNMILGVYITPEEKQKCLKLKNKFKDSDFISFKGKECLIVCICAGYSDEERVEFTKHKPIGVVAEIKANEIFKDTGKLRHPRFMRLREDKLDTDCTFKDHISQ